MKEYETVYIAQPDFTDAQIGDLNDRIKSIVEKNEGTLFFARNMGKKKLAYTIEKKTKGIYYCLDYAAAGDTVHEIERVFRLNEDVIRFLTTIKVEKVDIEARRAEIAARGEDKSVEPEVPATVDKKVEEKAKVETPATKASAGEEVKTEEAKTEEKPAEEKPAEKAEEKKEE